LIDPPGPDPFDVFVEWFADAREHQQAEPEAAALATADPNARSSVRYVLIRGFDRRGFVFYTNRQSRKGLELAANPWASLVYRWSVVDRQVRVAGRVNPVSDKESDAYFASRPRGSQLSAWASDQSTVISGRDLLDQQFAQSEARFAGGPVPRPQWWGGYRLEPEEFEFWQQGRSRLHDRFRYMLSADGGWSCDRLSP
jgi:pyridoxamine 5'-phosphate oxidase